MIHFIAARVAFRYGGPFFNGGVWIWLWVGAALLIPLVMAGLVPIGEYGASSACFQLCGYPLPPIVFLAFYPWLGLAYDRLRPAASALFVVVVAAIPIAIMVGINGDLNSGNWLGWANGASGYVLAYIGGLMFGRITRDAADAQVGAQQEAYTEIFRTLHDNVQTTLDAVKLHYQRGEDSAVAAKLQALILIVSAERDRLTFAQREVSLPHIISRNLAQVVDLLDRVDIRRMGSIYVSQELGIFLNGAIGALFRNVIAQTSARHMEVDARVINDELLIMQVCDDGPGLDESILDDPSKSLHDLRERARLRGGDLIRRQSKEFTTCIEIWIPLYEDE
ncbi:sensor histidine kinase [Kribbella monticola]|uniref:hypothetical protein n=1 Tax=Kribbella monticola TaxID=2185285 RepID=UPI001300A1A1|nr:hypothetical protein [Kribbella monticola]